MIRGSGWFLLASAAAVVALVAYAKKNKGLHQLDESDFTESVEPVRPEETATKAEAIDKTLVTNVNKWMLRQSWYRQPGQTTPPRLVQVDWVARSSTLPDGTVVTRGEDRIAEIRSERGQIYYVLCRLDGTIQRLS